MNAKKELKTIIECLEKHPVYNEEIAQAIERNDDFTLAVKVGGDEATISELAARARRALAAIEADDVWKKTISEKLKTSQLTHAVAGIDHLKRSKYLLGRILNAIPANKDWLDLFRDLFFLSDFMAVKHYRDS